MSKMIDKELTPDKIKAMALSDLELLSYEIRDFLIENIAKTGGHLASNLGVVELTIALHKVFDLPRDKLIWDVGHQAYVHKILTGRAQMFGGLRQTGGISGFPKRDESEYDFYDSGHSSSSISAAYGMASARDLEGDSYEVVAVIGDGALTGGMAYEALNNAGASNSKMIVVLNDNQMSISQNTGGITKHLSKLRTSKGYLNFKKHLKTTLKNIPNVGESIYRGAESLRDSLKYALVDGGAIFEELGFTYLGPINGNNLEETIEALTMAKRAEGPVLVHVTTVKGKGYKNAETHPNIFHGVGPFDQSTGKPFAFQEKTFAQVFGDKMCCIADENEKVVAISAAMIDGTGLDKFARRFPTRMFDVGIAEEHAVTFVAGMALGGMIPVFAVYSSFLQRAVDQIVIDVCIDKLPVTFLIDHSGFVEGDGITHQGLFDLSMLGGADGLVIASPMDGEHLKNLLDFSVKADFPLAIRYPKSYVCEIDGVDKTVTSFKWTLVRDCGSDTAILVHDSEMLSVAVKTSGADIIFATFVKPLDERFLSENKYSRFIVPENNIPEGGLAQCICAYFMHKNIDKEVIGLAIDKLPEYYDKALCFEKYGLTTENLNNIINNRT